jgi:hypothetical protein
MMQSALRKDVDVVLAESLDRFSRDQEDTAGLFNWLRGRDLNPPPLGYERSGSHRAVFITEGNKAQTGIRDHGLVAASTHRFRCSISPYGP